MKKVLYLLTGLSLMTFGSCIKSDNVVSDSRADLHLSIEVQPLTSASATRSGIAAEPGEDQISSLYLLFFAPDANQNGTYQGYVQVPNITSTSPSSMQADIDLSSVGGGITATDAYDILAVANIADNQYLAIDGQKVTVEDWMGQWAGKTEHQVLFAANALVQGSAGDENAIAMNQLLMSAQVSKSAGSDKLSLTLTRSVSRIDVYNGDSSHVLNLTYDLVSASIYNAYPTTPIWGGAAVDYSASVARTERFYGVSNLTNRSDNNEDGTPNLDNPDPNATLGNIIGGLYCFENQSTDVKPTDKQTTCLIIGLQKRNSDGTRGDTEYFRANVCDETTTPVQQLLARNTDYRITLQSVTGDGYATEELAYNGQGNNLIYTVNAWNLDDNGLIVQDDNSIMSLPTKTITFGREGGPSDYSFMVSSKLPNPDPLTVVSQSYDPEFDITDSTVGIRAEFDGNVLHVTAQPLEQELTERRGVIVVSYAGLQSYVNVIQSGDATTYLTVTLPDGGIPTFIASANVSSGLITVDASGPWSAKIYMPGFSFTQGQSVTEIHSTDKGYVTNGNQFRIFTDSFNEESALRNGFVIVSLDSDPDNYQAVVRVAQKPAGKIVTDPDQKVVTWDGAGTLAAGDNNKNTFKVLPDLEHNDDTNTDYVPQWKAEIVQSGTFDDRAYFTVNPADVHFDPNVQENNTVKVTAKGMNTLGRDAIATLRISLTNDPGTFTDITLVQHSLTISLNPSAVGNVSSDGGKSDPFTVNCSVSTLTWSAAVTAISDNVASDGSGRHLVHYDNGYAQAGTPDFQIQLVDPATGEELVAGQQYPLTQQFAVQFPKIYYPNRNIPISATVEVTVAGMKTMTMVNQTPLMAKPVKAYGVDDVTYTYGNLGDDVLSNGEFYGHVGDYGYEDLIPSYSWNTSDHIAMNAANFTSIPNDVRYLQVGLEWDGSAGSIYAWTPINAFIDNENALTFFSCDYYFTQGGATNNPNSPLKKAGYGDMQGNIINAAGGGDPLLTSDNNTKVYQYVIDRGLYQVTAGQLDDDFPCDGASSYYKVSELPGYVVPLFVNDNGNTPFLIDPKNRFVFRGETGMLASPNADEFKLLGNIVCYIGNTAMYGSNFSDLLIDAGKDPAAQPAPWDSYWGPNAEEKAQIANNQ